MHRYPAGYERDLLDWLFPILMLLLLIGLFVTVVMTLRRRPIPEHGDPLRRAAARYAAGDIERVEFERIQQDLATVSSAPPGDAAPGDTPGD